MSLKAVLALLLCVSSVSASSYTGICFLDAILNALDSASARMGEAINPTTTTTSTSTTTATTTSSTTTYTLPPTTTSTSTSTTSTTLDLGKCASAADCPSAVAAYTCDMDNHILVTTTNYFCTSPATPQSQCIGKTTMPRIFKTCMLPEQCVKGADQCIRIG